MKDKIVAYALGLLIPLAYSTNADAETINQNTINPGFSEENSSKQINLPLNLIPLDTYLIGHLNSEEKKGTIGIESRIKSLLFKAEAKDVSLNNPDTYYSFSASINDMLESSLKVRRDGLQETHIKAQPIKGLTLQNHKNHNANASSIELNKKGYGLHIGEFSGEDERRSLFSLSYKGFFAGADISSNSDNNYQFGYASDNIGMLVRKSTEENNQHNSITIAHKPKLSANTYQKYNEALISEDPSIKTPGLDELTKGIWAIQAKDSDEGNTFEGVIYPMKSERLKDILQLSNSTSIQDIYMDFCHTQGDKKDNKYSIGIKHDQLNLNASYGSDSGIGLSIKFEGKF